MNIIGEETLLEAVVNCWSSLWTARAIGYRARNDIAHEGAALAVVVQVMVPAEASGVLFTANPLTGKRSEMVIDATMGLGEALVSGQVEPDHYIVESVSGEILHKKLGAKALAIQSKAGGGVQKKAQDASRLQAIPDSMIRELVSLGRQVSRLYETPQDIEWSWAVGEFWLLQSRAITSLFPIPERQGDEGASELQVYFSFAAVQGLMDPITPLGQDAIRTVFAGAGRLFGVKATAESQQVITDAGERLWGNMTPLLRHPIGRRLLLASMGMIEPGAQAALQELAGDPRLQPQPGWFKARTARRIARFFGPVLLSTVRTLRRPESARLRFQAFLEAYVADVSSRQARAKTLAARVALFEKLVGSVFVQILPRFLPIMAASMGPLQLLQKLADEVDRPSLALETTRGLPQNVTTEMDLALWRTAQSIQSDPTSRAYFNDYSAGKLSSDYLAARLPAAGQTAVSNFLQLYGMRGLGEIDIGRPRWREDPTPIMQILQSYLQIDDPNMAPDVVFKRGEREAAVAVVDLETAVSRKLLGRFKSRLVRPAARRVRALAGLRESPKFTIIRIMWQVRSSLLDSGQTLVAQGVLTQPDDLFYLRLAELKALARGAQQDWKALIAKRRAAYAREQRRRQIPRVLLSDGQAFYAGVGGGETVVADANILTGSPVSPGVAEGNVHVVFNPHGVQLQPGEILVCPGTDPAWTPLFLAAGGLITEVGGLMTHGSVVAREYGIPAVVGVHQATQRLQTGQRVRIDGSAGRILILE